MFVDDHGGHVIPGMVCAWWFDGEKMFEPLVMRECRMASISDTHPLWPGEGKGEGAGAVIPLIPQDMSIGMAPGNKSFWIISQVMKRQWPEAHPVSSKPNSLLGGGLLVN